MTASLHVRDAVEADCPAYHFFDSLMIIRADGSDGGPVIIEAIVAPGGGAPLHVHAELDDSFYLISGRIAMCCGEDTFVVAPGDYVVLPHAVPHTFCVLGVAIQLRGPASQPDFERLLALAEEVGPGVSVGS